MRSNPSRSRRGTRSIPRGDRGRGLAPALVLTLLVPVLIMLLVWQQTSVDHLVVQLEKERDQNQELSSRVNALRLATSRLSSMGQVAARAGDELGLHRPGPEEIVDLRFEGDPENRPFSFRPLVSEATASPHSGEGNR
jgi:cell division protein FtsL